MGSENNLDLMHLMETACILCSQSFFLPVEIKNKEDLSSILTHLSSDHNISISCPEQIYFPQQYFEYWKNRLSLNSDKLENVFGVEKDGQKYFIDPEMIEEDRSIREKLQMKKLDLILKIQQEERNNEDFVRTCLFCKKTFSGNRKIIFDHLLSVHNFSVGLPDNLVYVSEFLDLIESKLNRLLCLYCEKPFKDWDTLKEHMRKKEHRMLNPDNHEYDRFYVLNYREYGKSWIDLAHDKDEFECDETLDDWDENICRIQCLLCDHLSDSMNALSDHMKNHGFNLDNIKQLSFYQKIKLVNFIRRCVNSIRCFNCKLVFENSQKLRDHLKMTDCCHLPKPSDFDNDENYVPFLQDDQLLHNLTDDEEDYFGC